jgi:hypothetical protein
MLNYEIHVLATSEPSGPWQAHARIKVIPWAREGEDILLSPDCVCAAEIKAWADRSIAELEKLKRRADQIEWCGSESK